MKQVEMRATAGNVPDMVEEGLFDKAMLQRQTALANPTADSAPADQTDAGPDPDGSVPELTWEEAVERVRQYHIDNPRVDYADLRVGIATTILRYHKQAKDLSAKQRTGMQYAFRQAGIEWKTSPNGGHRLLNAAVQSAPELVEAGWDDQRGQIITGAKSQFWKQPANQWFNFGDNKIWEDAKGQRVSPKTVLLAISQWKADLQSPSDAAKAGGDAFAACYAAYEWLKQNDPAAPARRDHDDVLIEACQLLVAKPSALNRMKAEKKFILVDEAQDLNKAQHLLFGLIAGYYDPETQKPNEDGSMTADTYCFIGDDKQAIYEFRGADPDVFIELSTVHGFNTKLLEMNYRSGSAIVDAANKLIAHNTKQIPMVCEANPSRGMGNIQATVVDSHMAGAAMAATEIEGLVNAEDAGFSPADFGVACRTTAELHAYCMELTVRGVPFRCPKVQLFNDRTSKALINWLSLATVSDSDNTAINKIVLEAHTAPRFSLDKRFNDHLQRAAKGQNYLAYLESGGWRNVYPEDQAWRNERNVLPYVRALRQMKDFRGSPAEALTAVLSLQGTFDPATGGAASIMESLIADARKDSEIMDLLHEEAGESDVTDEQIKDAAMAPVAPLMSLLERYEDLNLAVDYVHELQAANQKTQKKGAPKKANKKDTEYEAPAVTLDTVHGWKGLEADHMYVPMPGGVFPHVKSQTEEDLASERRLAYVAITRGRDSVKIISPKISHNGKPAGLSQFVSEGCIPVQGDESPTTGENPPAEEEISASVLSMETPTLWEEIKAELENERALRTAHGAARFSAMVLESFGPKEPQD
jgi:superfamily I DNA/RNA helicase